MVANVRCAEIRDEQLRNLVSDQAWTALAEGAMGNSIVPGLGPSLHGLVDSCIKGYETDAGYFDAKVRQEKLQELHARVSALLEPLVAHQTQSLASIKLGLVRASGGRGVLGAGIIGGRGVLEAGFIVFQDG